MSPSNKVKNKKEKKRASEKKKGRIIHHDSETPGWCRAGWRLKTHFSKEHHTSHRQWSKYWQEESISNNWGKREKQNRRTSCWDDRHEQRWYLPWWSDIPYCRTEGQCHLSKDLSKTDQEQVQPVLVEQLWSGLLLVAPETERNGISPRYGNLCLAAWSHRRWGSTSQSLNLTISCRSQRGWKVSESPYSFTGLSSVTQNYLLSML